MKKKEERKKWKGLKNGFLLMGFIALLIASKQTVRAEEINWQKAAEIAKRYVTLPQDDGMKAKEKGRKNKTGSPYYIYNDARGQGFVIVSGDDQMGEVLGYSKEGSLDTLNANPCVKLLLSGYRQTFEVLKEGKVKVQSHTRTGLYSKTVAPMLKSKWGQSYPFNAKTGYDYSGCVATAVAQMMYYHQWPAQGQGKNEYVVTYYQAKKSADFSQSHYDWANMLPDYRYPVQATPAEIDAVALLMNDVGVASFMQYTPSASGTQGVFAYQALLKHFDYSAAYVTKAVEGPGRFAEILRQELLNGCPVYLEGRPAGSASGHAWVTDGFDENGLFHMNFGWEGQGSKVLAFFTIKNLNGVPRDCYLRVKLLDENQEVVLSTRVDQLTEIDGFSETEIPILLSVPAQLAPGYYQVKLEITSDEAETQDCPVNGIHDQDAAYIEVVKGEEKPLMAKAEVFLADDAHVKIETRSVDVSKVSLFKMGVSLRTTEDRSYEGHVSLISEDVDTKEEIEVNGLSDDVTVSSAFDVPLYSYWLRKNNLPWTDGHTYLFRVMGEIGGKKVELKNPQEPSYFLKRKGDILILYQDTATGIENATISDTETEICREGHQLLVSGKDVRKIKLYHAGGNLLRQASATDGKTVSLSLQGIRQGVYLLWVETGMQSKTYKLLL